jgi:putative resolvase
MEYVWEYSRNITIPVLCQDAIHPSVRVGVNWMLVKEKKNVILCYILYIISKQHLLHRPLIEFVSSFMTGTKDSEYRSLGAIQKKYSVSGHTLRAWATAGKIKCVRTSAKGKRLYNLQSIDEHMGLVHDPLWSQKKNIIYARVSSSKQQADLQRQRSDLCTAYPGYEVIQDIGSGLNFRRRGLQSLLEQVLSGLVATIVVAYKDRLCRYGCELLESIFKHTGTKLVVHGKTSCPDAASATQELAEDLLAVTTVFVARHNGRRSAANRRRRADKRKRLLLDTGSEPGAETGQAPRGEGSSGPCISNSNPERASPTLVRGHSLDLQPVCGGHTGETSICPVKSPTSVHRKRRSSSLGVPVGPRHTVRHPRRGRA